MTAARERPNGPASGSTCAVSAGGYVDELPADQLGAAGIAVLCGML